MSRTKKNQHNTTRIRKNHKLHKSKKSQKGGQTEKVRALFYYPHYSNKLYSKVRVIKGPDPIEGFFDLDGISKMVSYYSDQTDEDLRTIQTGKISRQKGMTEKVYDFVYGNSKNITQNQSQKPAVPIVAKPAVPITPVVATKPVVEKKIQTITLA